VGREARRGALMRNRDRFLSFFFLLSLTLVAAGASAQAKPQKSPPPQGRSAQGKDPYVERFKQLDRDGDGSVSQKEWPLEPASFQLVDRNKDGRLSPAELLTPNDIRRDPRDEQFRKLDTTRDGRLSRTERQNGGTGLDRLDRDADGYVTRRGYGSTWRSDATLRDQQRFRSLDRNQDNLLSRPEWTGVGTRFDHLDRNRDGVISPGEWPG